jgi:chemotaxis-related protein WspB
MLVLTFQVGDTLLALDVRRVHEVVPLVRLQRVECAPPWLAGVFIYRGRVVPVVDLHRLIGAGECPPNLSTRIILVPHALGGEVRLVGLLASRVADLRDIRPPAGSPGRGTTTDQPDLGPVLVDGNEIIHLVEPDRLLPESHGRQLALIHRELPA